MNRRANIAAGVLAALAAGAAVAQPTAPTTAAGAPELLPPARNIFFPALPAQPARRVAPPQPPSFVLAGTMATEQARSALLEYPDGRLQWVAAGDEIDGLKIIEVTDERVVFQHEQEQLALRLGGGGVDLAAAPRVLRGGFEVLGVCRGDSDAFALVQLRETDEVRRVHAEDRLAGGVVASIAEGGLVIELDGATRTVPVGGAYDAETQVQ